MTEPSESGILAAEHVLLGTISGGASGVDVRAEGEASWRGAKLAGAAGFFPAGRRMSSHWPKSDFTYIKLAIDPSATEDLLHVGSGLLAWRTRCSAEDSFISAALPRLASALRAGPEDTLASLTAETIATALHLHAVSRFSNLQPEPHAESGGLGSVLDLIHSALPRAVSLADMVQASGWSRGRFLVAFHRTTGQSPHQYILKQRLSRARHLVETTRLPLGEIAVAVGCSNAGHFSRMYASHFSSTPLAWRHRYGRS